MEWVEIVMEEYKTLREESLTSMKMQQSILSFGTATIGIVISAGLTIWDKVLLPEIVFLFLIPTVIYFIILIWLGEVGRMFRAGRFLSQLEEKINKDYPNALSWETWLSTGEWSNNRLNYWIRQHYVCIFMLFIIIAYIAVLMGNIKIYDKVSWPILVVINLAEFGYSYITVVISISVTRDISFGKLIKAGH